MGILALSYKATPGIYYLTRDNFSKIFPQTLFGLPRRAHTMGTKDAHDGGSEGVGRTHGNTHPRGGEIYFHTPP